MWANVISLLRIPLAAAFFLTDRADLRVIILAAAAATDYIDGWVARRWGQASLSGEIIDPLADKVFVVTALATLVHDGALNIAEVIVLIARDIVTMIGFATGLALGLRIRYRARFSGKVVTTLQLATVIAATAFTPATRLAVFATGVAGAWAVADYLAFGVRSLRRTEPSE